LKDSRKVSNNPLVVLYQEMADLTRPKCGQGRAPLSCCDEMYCELAAENIKEAGLDIPTTGHVRLPYMGPNGCVVPPYLRQLCTFHVCSITGLGFDPKDPEFTKQYFALRTKITKIEAKQHVV
jgi:hypothetical protein